MDENNKTENDLEKPESGKSRRLTRAGLHAVGGMIPLIGGLLTSAASYWAEGDQERVNKFLENWLKMIDEELREKERTILEIAARVDMQDEPTVERLQSDEYQSLLKKAFREWSNIESEQKRLLVRNILANAASTDITSDDVVRLFLAWIAQYSDLHFLVISTIYNSGGISRGEIWRRMDKDPVREDSAEADLYKLIFRDLSTGGIVRQHRETDYQGNFIKKRPSRRSNSGVLKSAFDEEEMYELTELGKQFVHYALTDLTPKISFDPSSGSEQAAA